MAGESERTNRLLRELLDSYAKEYGDLQSTWGNLEKKAQASIAVAGVFLGGLLSFARDIRAGSPISDRVFASVVIALMVLAILSAGRAMRVRTVFQPALGSNVRPMIDRLLDVETEGEQRERETNLLRDWRNMWQTTNSGLEELNKAKARAVNVAQLSLFGATLVGVAWTLAKILLV